MTSETNTQCSVATSQNQQGIVRGSTTRLRTSCDVSMNQTLCQAAVTNYMCFVVTNASNSSYTDSNDANDVYCLDTSSFKSCDFGL